MKILWKLVLIGVIASCGSHPPPAKTNTIISRLFSRSIPPEKRMVRLYEDLEYFRERLKKTPFWKMAERARLKGKIRDLKRLLRIVL